MPLSANSDSLVDDPPADLLELGVYADDRSAAEHGLVVLALGAPYWLIPSERGHRLLVEPRIFDPARDHLDRFQREQTRWPPPPPEEDLAAASRSFELPVGWIAMLLATYWAQGAWPRINALGALDAAAVQQGEWWRAFTALWLHADAAHLLANGFSGFFLFATVLTTLGRARGWLLIVCAAIATNLTLALAAADPGYRSIGASTAVFSALGLLTGRAIRLAAARRVGRWRPMGVPLAAGLTTLTLFGSGDARVDVAAHVVAFMFGTLLGLIFGCGLKPRPPRRSE